MRKSFIPTKQMVHAHKEIVSSQLTSGSYPCGNRFFPPNKWFIPMRKWFTPTLQMADTHKENGLGFNLELFFFEMRSFYNGLKSIPVDFIGKLFFKGLKPITNAARCCCQ